MIGAEEVPLEGGPENWWIDRPRLLYHKVTETEPRAQLAVSSWLTSKWCVWLTDQGPFYVGAVSQDKTSLTEKSSHLALSVQWAASF